METNHAFALLVSVPEIHLISGLDAIATQLDVEDLPPAHSPKVVFGSMDFVGFGEVEKLRGGEAIKVLTYASQAKGEQPLNPAATRRGVYVGYVASCRSRYPGKSMYRPPSNVTDPPTWVVFWEVQVLEQLKTPIPIGNLCGKNKKTAYPARFIPEGPVLIEYPKPRS
jgi:hypothetical protein